MLSIVASETSVLTFVSVPGLAYRGDWSFLQLAMGYIVGRVLVSAILLPMYFRHGVSSIYEIIGLRFGSGMQKVAAVAVEQDLVDSAAYPVYLPLCLRQYQDQLPQQWDLPVQHSTILQQHSVLL